MKKINQNTSHKRTGQTWAISTVGARGLFWIRPISKHPENSSNHTDPPWHKRDTNHFRWLSNYNYSQHPSIVLVISHKGKIFHKICKNHVKMLLWSWNSSQMIWKGCAGVWMCLWVNVKNTSVSYLAAKFKRKKLEIIFSLKNLKNI